MVNHEIKVIDVIEDKPPEINNEQIETTRRRANQRKPNHRRANQRRRTS